MAKAMLVTVGKGGTVHKAIVRSIRVQNPDRVWFLFTPGSKDTVQKVIQVLGLDEERYRLREHGWENRVDKLCEIYDRVLDEVFSEGFRAEEVVADFTSGTKPMSCALFAVGLANEIDQMSYVAGERDEHGNPVAGTEFPVMPSFTRLYLEMKLRRVPELFNTYQYEACLLLLDDFMEGIEDARLKEKLSFLRLLAESYMHWDRFELDECFGKLKELGRRYRDLLEAFGLRQAVARHKALLAVECGIREDTKGPTKDGLYCVERLADLFANALRRKPSTTTPWHVHTGLSNIWPSSASSRGTT